MSLTNKQRVFVEEYLRTWNATEAARIAGYAYPNVEGPKNLVKPSIATEIKQRIDEKSMTADEVLLRLAEQARGEHGKYLTPEGVDLSRLLGDGKGYLIKKVKQAKVGKAKTVTEVEFYDGQSALVHLGRYHALFTDKVKQVGWQDEIVQLLRDGRIKPEDVVAGWPSLADELFARAGVHAHGSD